MLGLDVEHMSSEALAAAVLRELNKQRPPKEEDQEDAEDPEAGGEHPPATHHQTHST